MFNRLRSESGQAEAGFAVGGFIFTVFLIWLVIFLISLLSARATPQAGDISVVRSGPSAVWFGSWFNGHQIKKVIPQGSGSSFIGLGSEVHSYPSSSVQRTYTITSDPSRGDRPGVDVVEVPTSDGVRVGLEGAFYFTTAFDNSGKGQSLVKDFDNRFGVRTFPVTGSSGSEIHPWEGTDGWSAFLDTVIRPIIDNDLRRSIAGVSCPQLVSSCALVHNNGNVSAAAASNGQVNSQSIQQIQTEINSGLESDIKNTLGVDYFSNVQFLLSKVSLPQSIQDQIDNAQAQFASVGAASAEVQRSNQLAKAKAALQHAYQSCPTCAQIDTLKALPQGLTTLVLPGGNGQGLSLAIK